MKVFIFVITIVTNNMYFLNFIPVLFAFAFAIIATVQACTHCPHPGNFTGRRTCLHFYIPSFFIQNTPINHMTYSLDLTDSVIIETVGWLRNATAAYCGLEGTPINSTYASVSAAFFDPPE